MTMGQRVGKDAVVLIGCGAPENIIKTRKEKNKMAVRIGQMFFVAMLSLMFIGCCSICRSVKLQEVSPGRQQNGNVNISGTVMANNFVGDGSTLTGINGGSGADNDWIIRGTNMYSGVTDNVGIGTTSPMSTLDVVGIINASEGINVGGIAVSTGPHTTDATLTEAQVDAFVSNNNFSTGAHTSDTTLTEAQVDDFVSNNNFSTGAHTSNTHGTDMWTDAPGQVTTTGNVGIGTLVPETALHFALPQSGDDGILLSVPFYPGWDNDAANAPFINWQVGNSNNRYGMRYYFDEDNSREISGLRFGKWDSSQTSPFTEHVIFTDTGDVGIGTKAPNYKLHVEGTAYATGAAGTLSDIRHKRNIQPVSDGALDIIGKLSPITYEWKNPADSGMEGTQIGLIAQEVEKVLPEVVLTQDDEDQTKALKYNELIPMIIKAIQEVEEANVALKTENKQLSEKLAAVTDRQEALKDMFLSIISTNLPKEKLVKNK